MPMQLAEACMSAEFINLHLLWAGGEEVKECAYEGGEEEGSNTRAGFVSARPESERRGMWE